MIVRKLDNDRVIVIHLGLDPSQEEEFISINQTGGFMLIDNLPEQPEMGLNYRWDGSNVVVDEETNSVDLITLKVESYRAYLNSTDFKFTTDYDNADGDVEETATLRGEAREYIRTNALKE